MFSEDNSPKAVYEYILPYHIETNSNYQTTVYHCYYKTLVENKNSFVINNFSIYF
jgi:hypothetical protein